MPPRGINSKKFHRKILEELKGNFYRPTLDHTHKLIAEQKLKTMKHLDEEHCPWLLVLGKTHKDFQHKFFLYRFPEIIPKIYDIREIVGLRMVEWDNKNPKDPVRQCQNEINNRSVEERMKDSSANGQHAVSASPPETIPTMPMDLDEVRSTVMEEVRELLNELVTKVSRKAEIPLSRGVTCRKVLKKQETLQPMKRDYGFETSKETVNSRISTSSEHSQEITEDETSFGRMYKRLKLSL